MIVVAIHTGLDEREIRRDGFELVAVHEREHTHIAIFLQLHQRIAFGEGLGTILGIERREADQPHLETGHLIGRSLDELSRQRDVVRIFLPVFLRHHTTVPEMLDDFQDVRGAKRLDDFQDVAGRLIERRLCCLGPPGKDSKKR